MTEFEIVIPKRPVKDVGPMFGRFIPLYYVERPKSPNILQRFVSWFKRIGVNESYQSSWKDLDAREDN